MTDRRRVTEVRAERIHKAFGRTRALQGVDLTVTSGEVVSLEGPNGSGKSTLLGVLATLIRPTKGRVVYAPRTTAAPSNATAIGSLWGVFEMDERILWRREIGFVSHEPLAYGELTGRENLAIAAEAFGLSPEETFRRAHDRFDLLPYCDRPLRTNSRGQRQKFALARALAHAPSVLLLDEPTTGLDTASTVRLVDVLAEEARGGTCIVVVTHDPASLARLSPRRIVLGDGQIKI